MICQGHTTSAIVFEDGSELLVDTEIAELVENISNRGWGLGMCCQDHDGRVLLTFPFPDELEEFLTVVAGDASPLDWSLHHCITRNGFRPGDPNWDRLEEELYWHYEAAGVMDINDGPGGKRYGPVDVRLAMRVLFPREHLPGVKARLRGDDVLDPYASE